MKTRTQTSGRPGYSHTITTTMLPIHYRWSGFFLQSGHPPRRKTKHPPPPRGPSPRLKSARVLLRLPSVPRLPSNWKEKREEEEEKRSRGGISEEASSCQRKKTTLTTTAEWHFCMCPCPCTYVPVPLVCAFGFVF